MRLLLDQGLPRSAAALLRGQGTDAVHTGEIGLATATDDEILDHARHENRVVVTLDADFHALLALAGASSPSVIRIRIEGLRASALGKLLGELLDDWNAELDAGVLFDRAAWPGANSASAAISHNTVRSRPQGV